jgi:hypothetical protein
MPSGKLFPVIVVVLEIETPPKISAEDGFSR